MGKCGREGKEVNKGWQEMLYLGAKLWRYLSLLRGKETGIVIHKIPIRHWSITASRTINSLALQSCPLYRTVMSSGKN